MGGATLLILFAPQEDAGGVPAGALLDSDGEPILDSEGEYILGSE